jgi:hypothetical protein
MSVSWAGGLKRGPSWEAMVDQAARLLGCNDGNLLRLRGNDLQILEFFKITNHELAPLTNWLAIAYHRAAGVYTLDKEMQELGTAAVHLLTMATSYMSAHDTEGAS